MKTTESLKEKLVAERQSKLLLEVKIRKEMAEEMFRQLLETEEAWRQVMLQSYSKLNSTYIKAYTYIHARHACSYCSEKLRLTSFKDSDEKRRGTLK